MKQLHRISDILQQPSNKKEVQPAFICIYLFKNWKQIVGPQLAKDSQPVGYKNHCLWVRLASSCHIQEMNFEKQNLITKINQSLAASFVQDIRWTL